MKVRDIMTAQPKTASRDTTLAAAAHLLWGADCGILPVVDGGKLVGVVTDRDMYIALATRDKPASHLTIGDVATAKVWACGPDDDVHVALDTMASQRVRRASGESGRRTGRHRFDERPRTGRRRRQTRAERRSRRDAQGHLRSSRRTGCCGRVAVEPVGGPCGGVCPLEALIGGREAASAARQPCGDSGGLT